MNAFTGNIKYSRVVAIFFALIILVGSFLLSLPISSKSGGGTPFVNALFTATSATCVTGMVVYDTYSHWSVFGQFIIISLVQIGGVGFMMVATLFSLLLKRKIGLNERMLLQEASGSMQLGGVVRLARRILLGTLIFEGTGAILLALRFCPKMGFREGLYNAVFHSIAAFCNAGFDLMGKYGRFSSLSHFSGDPIVCATIALLIVIGGIGFFVWDDIVKNKWCWNRYTLHTKVVVSTTGILIFMGAAFIFVSEASGSLHGMNVGNKVASSLFHSISFRTAGFTMIDMSSLSSSTVFITILLMLIGGSPGSTAGGIKTTTLFIMVATTVATLTNKRDINAFHRRFEDDAFRKAYAISAAYIGASLAGVAMICLFEDLPMASVIFEVFSGVGTVGLSLGITSELLTLSKLTIVCLMYFGRVGILSIIYALIRERTAAQLQYPQEKLMIG